MLAEKPKWTFVSKRPLTQWYDHAHLLADHILGQWFCLTRESGELIWQRRIRRANTIRDVDSGVIVAEEMRSDGPWTASFGCYGISLQTGRLLWTSHGTGIWGGLFRMLDFVPLFTNELRDSPHHIKNGRCFCRSGRVLSVTTGRQLDRVPSDEVTAYKAPEDPARQLYDTSYVVVASPVEIGTNRRLTHPRIKEGEGRLKEKWHIYMEDDNCERIWEFDVKDTGRHIDGNYYSYRLIAPYIYLVVSEEPCFKPHPSREHYVLPNPTLWHLMTLDISSGKIVQDFPLSGELRAECRIEDADENAVLIGNSKRELSYYERSLS